MVHSFESVIVKVELPTKLDRIQLGSHVNESSILQLINDISKDLQRLLKYFGGTTIFTSFFIPIFSVWPIRFDLYLNDDELFGIWLSSTAKSTFPSISSLLNCHKLPEVSEYLSLYSI